jgi:hypothetical protein
MAAMEGHKSEIRNPKSETNPNWGRKGNGENGGLSANFANFREFSGRGNLTSNIELRTSNFEPRNEETVVRGTRGLPSGFSR